MKHLLLLVSFFIPQFLFSQSIVLTENFDSYLAGSYGSQSSAALVTWSGGGDGTTEDSFIIDSLSSSPSNSLSIIGPQAGGTTDINVEFPSTYTTGFLEFSMKFHVAVGKGGYFNAQKSTNSGVAWMVEAYFAADGTGTFGGGGLNNPFNYTVGSWVDIDIKVDLDSDTGELYIDNVLVGTPFQWSIGTDGSVTGAGSWGAINFYSASGDPVADCEYYVDDIELTLTPFDNSGISESITTPSFLFGPNPSDGQLFVDIANIQDENASVRVLDLQGKQVFTEKINGLGHINKSYSFNFPAGTYILQVIDGNSSESQKFIVQ